MVDIAGFRALRYAPSVVGPLAQVVAPPYDVIGTPELERLWARHPYNVVRLILPAGAGHPEDQQQGYGLAAERLRQWKQAGALALDARPSLYLYRQQFELPDGQRGTRQGFFALARLTEWGEGIYRHELTLPGPVSDRIRLLEACQANLSSVFGLYSDPAGRVIRPLLSRTEGQPALIELVDDRGVRHALWAVSDPVALRQVAEALRERPVIVADGHHRYTAALQYRNRRRRTGVPGGQLAPWDYALFYLDAFEDPGLLILPTHQVLQGLPGFAPERLVDHLRAGFAVRDEPSLEALLAGMAEPAGAAGAVLGAVVQGPRYYLLLAGRAGAPQDPDENLDVAVLRRRAVEPLLVQHGASSELEGHLRYTHDAYEAAAWVSTGQANVAFIVRPTPLPQVREVALARRVMPQKSTYFHPKLLSGLVFYDHASAEPSELPLPAQSAALP